MKSIHRRAAPVSAPTGVQFCIWQRGHGRWTAAGAELACLAPRRRRRWPETFGRVGRAPRRDSGGGRRMPGAWPAPASEVRPAAGVRGTWQPSSSCGARATRRAGLPAPVRTRRFCFVATGRGGVRRVDPRRLGQISAPGRRSRQSRASSASVAAASTMLRRSGRALGPGRALRPGRIGPGRTGRPPADGLAGRLVRRHRRAESPRAAIAAGTGAGERER